MDTKTEKKMVEVFVTTYVAEDGKEFESEHLCKEYEDRVKNERLKARLDELEIKDMYGLFPIDTQAQYINDTHEYNWYRLSSEADYLILTEMYGDDITRPKSYPEIICVEHDAFYDKDVWAHLLTEMLEDTINFWKKQGYDTKIKKL